MASVSEVKPASQVEESPQVEASQVEASQVETESRAARRQLIARALLGHLPVNSDPRRNLFHFDQEMTELFAKNRLSSYAVIPAFVLIMGAAVGWLGNPYYAGAWVAMTLLVHLYAMSAARCFLREGLSKTTLVLWKRRFVLRDLAYGLAWAAFPLLMPPGADAETASGFAIIRLAAVIVVLAVGALLSAPIPAAAVASTLPIALCMAVVHLLDPNFFNISILISTLTAEMLLLYLTGHLYEQNARSLAYRAEKDALFAELEQEKAVSDESRRRAETANNAKSQFLATMSHELRTPLNAILGFSDLMRGEMLGPIGNEAYKSYLDDIHSSGQHLLRIINDILDLSRIEAGKRALREELTSLSEVAREACSLLDLKARQKSITVKDILEDGLPRIVIDEQAIRQVILNLVSNALKFTPEGGDVTVKVGRTKSGGQYISVRDNGPGIPEKEIPVVLSAFGQGAVSLKTAEQGTGLGIPIVQALIHQHGGNFTLRSKVGVGTEAIATLPAKRVVSTFNRDIREDKRRRIHTPLALRRAS